jgi:thiamine-monophosphate kinase
VPDPASAAPRGEFALIARLAATLGSPGAAVRQGIGDDCALLHPDLVWSLDLLVEDVHFRRSTTTPEDLGWKALAVNLSDLAACAAAPVAALAGVTLGPALPEDEVERLYRGLRACADAYGCPVVGGDLSRGPALSLAVTVLGRAEHPLRRDGARPGDGLYVTGELGGSEAGRLVLEGLVPAPAEADALAARHRRPVPRLHEAAVLAGIASAALDVSDGIASDARQLAVASGVAVVVDLDALPLQAGVAAVAAARGVHPSVLAASGGEDYELLVTLDEARVAAAGVALTRIGTVEAGPPSLRFTGAAAGAELRGFDHLAEGP